MFQQSTYLDPHERRIRLALWVAIIAGLFGAMGDVLMLGARGFARTPAEAALLVQPWRLFVGFYLGIVFIPLYVAGYWAVYERLKAAGPRKTAPLLALGVIGIVQGVAFHGLAASAVYIVQLQSAPGIDPFLVGLDYAPILVPPFVLLHVFLVVGTLILLNIRGSEDVDLPAWLILLSPGVLTVLMYAIAITLPALGDWLFPAAMNLAHVVFFTAVLRYYNVD